MQTKTKNISTNLFFLILFYIISVIAFIIMSTLVVFFFELFLGRSKSVFLFYTVYFVAAIINAFFYSSFSFDKLEKSFSAILKNLLTIAICILLSLLFIKLFYYYNQMQLPLYKGGELDYTVPGHKYVTWMYFIVLTVATSFFCYFNKKPVVK
jgi:Na+/melibiose symporter-like transporter